jgi:hypothetical protein
VGSSIGGDTGKPRRQRFDVLVQLLFGGRERMLSAAGGGVGTLLGPERTTLVVDLSGIDVGDHRLVI